MNNLPREYLIETDVAPAARMGAAPRRVPARGGAVGVARGKTMGVLGYGHLGRESARLGKALGMEVLACSSKGDRCGDEGYVVPGTGDPDGARPLPFLSLLKRRAEPQSVNR